MKKIIIIEKQIKKLAFNNKKGLLYQIIEDIENAKTSHQEILTNSIRILALAEKLKTTATVKLYNNFDSALNYFCNIAPKQNDTIIIYTKEQSQ